MLKALPFASRVLAMIGGVGLLGLVGCGAERPQSSQSRDLNSGVTSNNGGGMVPANFGSVSTIVK